MPRQDDRGAIGIQFSDSTRPVVSAEVTYGEFVALDTQRRAGKDVMITDDKGLTRSYPAGTISSFVFEQNPPYYARG